MASVVLNKKVIFDISIFILGLIIACINVFILLIIFGIYQMYGGLKRYLLVQKIKNTPTSKAASAAVGLVELKGTARCNNGMASPISKVKCAYWKIEADFYKSGKGAGWRRFFESDSAIQLPARDEENKSPAGTFYLEDETGKLLVDPKKGTVNIPRDNLFDGYISGKGAWGTNHEKIDQRVLDFMGTLDEGSRKKFMDCQNLRIQVCEYYIADGDNAYVLGSARPREGISSGIGSENLIVRWDGSDNLLYISDSGEAKLLESLSSNIYLKIFGGLALLAAGFYSLLI